MAALHQEGIASRTDGSHSRASGVLSALLTGPTHVGLADWPCLHSDLLPTLSCTLLMLLKGPTGTMALLHGWTPRRSSVSYHTCRDPGRSPALQGHPFALSWLQGGHRDGCLLGTLGVAYMTRTKQGAQCLARPRVTRQVNQGLRTPGTSRGPKIDRRRQAMPSTDYKVLGPSRNSASAWGYMVAWPEHQGPRTCPAASRL